VLVYFKEATASHFFNQPIHELFQQSVSLESVLLRSEVLVLEDQLYKANTDQHRISVVENFLIAQLQVKPPDKLVAAALALIHNSKGDIRISELAKNLNTSLSPLEKRFRQSVGTSAKKFASIIRMKHVINTLRQPESVTDISYQAGFYDQAHFIKEFKSFTGETPLLFLKSQAL
jgi:AraC-like DNA-binding protein